MVQRKGDCAADTDTDRSPRPFREGEGAKDEWLYVLRPVVTARRNLSEYNEMECALQRGFAH